MKTNKKQSQTFVKGEITPRQIKAIHAVVGKLGLDDDHYREILMERYRAKSCKELNWREAEELLGTLNGGPVVGAAPCGRPPMKYTDMDGRPGFANGGQLRLVDAMWSQVTRTDNEEDKTKALDSFCSRIAKVAGLRMLKAWQVERIVKALEAMGAVAKTKGGGS